MSEHSERNNLFHSTTQQIATPAARNDSSFCWQVWAICQKESVILNSFQDLLIIKSYRFRNKFGMTQEQKSGITDSLGFYFQIANPKERGLLP